MTMHRIATQSLGSRARATLRCPNGFGRHAHPMMPLQIP